MTELCNDIVMIEEERVVVQSRIHIHTYTYTFTLFDSISLSHKPLSSFSSPYPGSVCREAGGEKEGQKKLYGCFGPSLESAVAVGECVYEPVHVCAFVCACVHACVCVCMRSCVCACVLECVCVYMHAFVHACIKCVLVCMCVL